MDTINKPSIAYKIGFSSSLDPYSWSVHNELTKWKFDETNEIKLHRQFIKGYEFGLKLCIQCKREKRYDFAAGLVASIAPVCDSTVQV